MTGEEFMEAHGEQVCTALQTTIDFWEDASRNVDEPTVAALAAGQIESWRQILAEARAVVDGPESGEPGTARAVPFLVHRNEVQTEDAPPL